MNNVYVTAAGAFLPNEPIGNDEIEEVLGLVDGKSSRFRKRVLESNGIKHRYYARKDGRQTHLNEELAEKAVLAALDHHALDINDIQMLAVGTTMPDILVPGFASMVHGRLGGCPMEIISASGVCCSSMAALKSAYTSLRSGEHQNAVVIGSDLASAGMCGNRFSSVSKLRKKNEGVSDSFNYFNAEFLRWMLSDGAGALVLETQPTQEGVSLRVDWISLKSYANALPTCMYMGTNRTHDLKPGYTFQAYNTFTEAESAGLLVVRQDTNVLFGGLVASIVEEAVFLKNSGKLQPENVDHFLPHISSFVMKEPVNTEWKKRGIHFRDETWFTNLEYKGNTGAASMFIMLEEALNEGRFKQGDKIVCMVPESGRFSVSYAQFTCVDANDTRHAGDEVSVTKENSSIFQNGSNSICAPATTSTKMTGVRNVYASRKYSDDQIELAISQSPFTVNFINSENPISQYLAKELSLIWQEFCERLRETPVICAIENEQLSLQDYKLFLLNLRQQVIEGARWIARASSSMEPAFSDIRSIMIGHASEEHKDYQMLESMYVYLGGSINEIKNYPRNIGTEAFSSYMLHQASLPNPLHLLGAMFIVEGLGNKKALVWAEKIKSFLKIESTGVKFLEYHSNHDDRHFEKLEFVMSLPVITETIAKKIVKTAKTVARLYCLQLEELDNT